MARVAEIVGATVALAASDGDAVAPPVIPASTGSTSSTVEILAKRTFEVAWSHKMVERHLTVMTNATILFDLAEAINELVRELEHLLTGRADLAMGLQEVTKSGRVLRNALQIEGNMHQKSSDPAFDDTRLAKAYNEMITAFEHFDRHLQSLARQGS